MSAHQFNAVGVCVHCLAEEGNLWACSGEKPRIAAPSPHDLTPSEVALAKILAAYQTGDRAALNRAFYDACLIGNGKDEGGLSPVGAALLDRARKAGVL